MGGYANRVVTIHFPELSEENDDIFVVIRNPKTVALGKLETEPVATNDDGTPNEKAAAEAGYGMLCQLVIGGKLYDATVDAVDDHGDPVDQPLLTYPLTVDKARRLPSVIINKIFQRILEAQNPQ